MKTKFKVGDSVVIRLPILNDDEITSLIRAGTAYFDEEARGIITLNMFRLYNNKGAIITRIDREMNKYYLDIDNSIHYWREEWLLASSDSFYKSLKDLLLAKQIEMVKSVKSVNSIKS